MYKNNDLSLKRFVCSAAPVSLSLGMQRFSKYFQCLTYFVVENYLMIALTDHFLFCIDITQQILLVVIVYLKFKCCKFFVKSSENSEGSEHFLKSSLIVVENRYPRIEFNTKIKPTI